MGIPSLATNRPAATSLPNFALPPPELPSTRYPSHTSAAMLASPSVGGLGGQKAVSFASSAPRVPSSSTSFSPVPVSSNASTTTTVTTSNTDTALNSSRANVLTPSSGAAVSEGLSSTSSHNTSPQSAVSGGPPPYSNHMTGSWPTPGGTTLGGFSYSNSGPTTANSGPITQPPYPRTPSYGTATSPSVQHFPGRIPSITNGENQPSSHSYQDQPSFASPVGHSETGTVGGGVPPLTSPVNTQAPPNPQPLLNPPNSSTSRPGASEQSNSIAPLTSQEGSSYRPPPTPTSLYPPTSAPQQSNFPPYPSPVTQNSPVTSPTTSSGPIPRSLPSIPPMAPPLTYPGTRNHTVPPPIPSYSSYGTISGPVLSNIHHPGAPLAVVGGIPPGIGYGHHPAMPPPHPAFYSHHTVPPQHPDRERPFKCSECSSAFNRNHDLKRHKRIHLAVKPFGCDSCEKRFSRKDALKRHRLVKGCGSKTEGTATTSGNNTSSSNRGDDVKRDPSPNMVKNE